MSIRRGDLFWVDLPPAQGAEQAGRRPALVIQNDVGNMFASTTVIASLTTRRFDRDYPVNVHIPRGVGGLANESTVLLGQIRTIDKSRLGRKIGRLPPASMAQVNQAICISLGLTL